MVDIPLAIQQETGPSRAGAAKAPFSLADLSGEIALGGAIEQIGQTTLEKIIKAREANEKAEAVGAMNAEIEGFRSFVAKNPNAPIEKYQTESQLRISRINRLGSKATTGRSKQNITNLIARNKGVIEGRFLTTMNSVLSKQELARSEEVIKGFVANNDMKGLENHLFGEDGVVSAGLYEEGFARARFENIVREGSKSVVLGQAQSFRKIDESTGLPTGDIDLKAGQEFIRNSDLSAEDKLTTIRNLNTWHAQEQQALEGQREIDRDKINNQLYKDLDFTGAVISIDNSSLDEKEQGRKMKEARDLQLLWAKGGKDAAQEKTKSDLLVKIADNPRKYDEDFMSDEALAGRIHPSHLPQLKLWRDKVVKGLTGTISAKKGYKLLEAYNKKGVFGKGIDGASLYIETVDNFTEFLLEEDRSAKEVTEYIENMTPELGFWEAFWASERIVGGVRGFRKKGTKRRARKIEELVSAETERLAETEDIETPVVINPEKEPQTRDEFLETVQSINDLTNKELYFQKWKDKFIGK